MGRYLRLDTASNGVNGINGLPARSPPMTTIASTGSNNSRSNSPRGVPSRTLSGERRTGGLSRANSEPHLVLNMDDVDGDGRANGTSANGEGKRGLPDGTSAQVSRDDTICGGGTRHDRARKALRRARSMGRAKSMYDFGSIKTLLLATVPRMHICVRLRLP